ncbi:MAG: hypothetical protein O3C67_00765 [Cyanobacteria bacterium]|nr:hypothetical protein [Cyanobacteriota bacterium]
MQRQVIQSFLNLPGIMGLVLMDGRSRPYFCGIERGLNYQQREALIQGIQQVVNTTPADFESFTFHFSHHVAHIYKFVGGVILMVLTVPELVTEKYHQHIEALRQTCEVDAHTLVMTFRMLAGGMTLGGPASWQATPEPGEPDIALPHLPPDASPPSASTAPPWQDVLEALNSLSDGTTPYLGKIVVANTWRSTQRDVPQLTTLTVDRGGHFTLAEDGEIAPDTPLSPQDQAALQQWINAFIDRCSRIIRDYRATVLTTALNPDQRALLQLHQEPN